MSPRRAPSLVAGLLVLAGLVAAFEPACLEADDPPPAVVPDVSMRRLPEAAALLAENGINLERYYEHRYSQGYALGLVIQQKPRPGTLVKRGSGVQLMVMAAANGGPDGRLPDPAWPRVRPFAAPSVVPAGTPLVTPLVTPPPPPRLPGAQGGSEPGAPLAPEPPLPAYEPLPSAPPSGSPDAPAVAERATPGEVPDLRGLTLADAEQRAREAELELYVERVPGHPVGRVVTQVPEVGQQRAKGAVVKVTVTAGGDYDGETAPAPAVDVPRVMVPDLLDRTAPQAERILTDLGLVFKQEQAKSGLPGRVADQKPAAGAEVPKGSLVQVWILPAAPAPPGPSGSAPVGTRAPPAAPTAPSGAQAPAGVPAPIAPSEGTLMPKQPTLLLGFSWLPVEGAEAYLVEIEEQGPSGWLAGARKPVRATATTIELERIAATAGALRWRVRAILAGREGSPCDWVTLR